MDSTALQNSVLSIKVAYDRFFNKVSGFPKTKKKHNPRQSYTTSTAKMKDNKLFIPKLGTVKAKFHRGLIEGEIKNVTISYEAQQYHVSINYEGTFVPSKEKQKKKQKSYNKTVGIDLGINTFAHTSENEQIHMIELAKEYEAVIKSQKQLSRKKKGSKNRTKAKNKLAKKHLKLKNKRNDFINKTTNKLSENQTIVVEDLNIQNMLKTNKNLNRLIMFQGWGEFIRQLEYKQKHKGHRLIKVNPMYTSQKCSCCGFISKENRKTQANFKCIKCNYTTNADYNASLNILALA